MFIPRPIGLRPSARRPSVCRRIIVRSIIIFGRNEKKRFARRQVLTARMRLQNYLSLGKVKIDQFFCGKTHLDCADAPLDRAVVRVRVKAKG